MLKTPLSSQADSACRPMGSLLSDKAQGTYSSLVRAEIKEGEQVNLQGTSKESGRKQDMSSGILRLSVWSAHWASAQGLH